jgi:hypothetical protein
MQLVNATDFESGFTSATDTKGREHLIVVVKGTWRMPSTPGEQVQPDDVAIPLDQQDVFTGDPVGSAPLRENDFAMRKARCDVLVDAVCHAPGGHQTTRVQVGVRVGTMVKAFAVLGPRRWRSGLVQARPTAPEPFLIQPFSYNDAFGGVDQPDGEHGERQWYPQNHVGTGYFPLSARKSLDGLRLPCTEALDEPVTSTTGTYRPMALGPLGRAWQPRVELAGTYDEDWKADRAPFLPDDFDDRYFQAAPEDQQCPYLTGGEEVVLLNLCPEGRRSFRLPSMPVAIEYFYRDGGWRRGVLNVDTLYMEPHHARFAMTARAGLPLRRSLHEIECVVLGEADPSWYRERGLRRAPRGKQHHGSLANVAGRAAG